MEVEVRNQDFCKKAPLLTLSKSIFEFSIYSNFFVAAVTTTAAFYYQVNSDFLSKRYLAFLFCATLFIYIIDRHRIKKRDVINKLKRSIWLQKNKTQTAVLATLSFAVYSFLFLQEVNPIRALSVLSLLLLCLLYCGDFKITSLPAVKNLLLAGIWAAACVLMPKLWQGQWLDSKAVLPFILYFLSSFINSALCDEEDKAGDKQNNIKSLTLCLSQKHFHWTVNCLCIALGYLALKSAYEGFIFTAVALMLINYLKANESKSFLSDCSLCLPLLW